MFFFFSTLNSALKLRFIFTMILAFICYTLEQENQTNCGTLPENTPNGTLEAVINRMEDDQLADVLERLNAPREHIFQEIIERAHGETNTQILSQSTFRWEALLIFSTVTLMFLLWTFYKEKIMEILFDISQRVPEVLPQSFHSIIQVARQTNQRDTLREQATNYIQDKLSDPNTAGQVEAAFRGAGVNFGRG